ncbi:MAG: choice-of-anchor D domain-containing protein [Deltaproteobacteria bacterium]|nr:choice-of-anchor D domain-containing protein [Deltaproteobacteria bacterium]
MRDLRRLAGFVGLLPLFACDCGGEGLRGVAPAVIAEPSPLAFGQVPVGTTARKTLAVRNVGDAVLTVSGIELDAASDPGFSTDPAPAFDLAVAAERTVEVRFTPQELGSRAGTLKIHSNDPDEAVLEVALTAEGVVRPGPAVSVCVSSAEIPLPEACTDPLAIDFGSRAFGSTVEARIEIRSVGTEPLQLSAAKAQPGADPAFAFDPRDMVATLPPGAATSIAVRFSPRAPGPVTAAFAVQSDDPERDWVPVTITGRSLAPALCARPTGVDFGTVALGRVEERTIELSSCGDAPLVLVGLSVSGAEFGIVNSLTSSVTLAPGESHDVHVTYSPADVGRDAGILTVLSNLPDSLLPLEGVGAGCDLDALPRSLSFGAVGQGRSRSMSVVVSNLGAIDCRLDEARLSSSTSNEYTITLAPTASTTLSPGATELVEVTYSPSGSGDDLGTLELVGTDPSEPIVTVSLEGHAAGIGECTLEVRPSPIAFGGVTLGTTQRISVEVANVGGSLCTVGAIKLTPASDRSFSVATPALPMFIPSGASRTVDVTFRPTVAGLVSGTLEVYGLIPIRPNVSVPVSGAGSGPKLCVDPDPVVFGTGPVGAVNTRSASLFACGTEDVLISGLALPAPTSAEYTIPVPPTYPLRISVGTIARLELRFVGTDVGREDGILRISSNDAIMPVMDVDLIAAASSGPCGDLAGRICGVGGIGPIAGAKVRVDTASGPIETETNENGDFVLTCLPPGSVTVHASSGSWSTSFGGTVDAYSLTSIPGQQCLDPESAKIAVVWGQWDSFQDILTQMRVPYDLFGDANDPAPEELLLDPVKMAEYDIIFFNCGFGEGLVTGSGLQYLRDFVSNGGSIYASDWSYDVVEVGWPAAHDFYHDDAIENDAQGAGNFTGPAAVVDASLRTALGLTEVRITSCCTAIDSAGPGTTVYLEGDRLGDGVTRPLMTSFSPGPLAGRVFYTDFHNTDQVGILDIFEWLINQL